MRDDADAPDAEQWRAAVLRGVELFRENTPELYRIDPRPREQRQNHRRHRLVEFQQDVAHEPIADHDIDRATVGRARENIASLDVALEIEIRLEQCLMSFFHGGVALFRLFANAEQPDGWILPSEYV